MTTRLNVAIAGAGYFSQYHFDAWARCPEVDLVGVAESDTSKAKELTEQWGIPVFRNVTDLLAEAQPDLLDVITPPDTHFEIIELATHHKVDVVCQKPFCGDEATARSAVTAAEKAGIKLTIHENFRFQPWYSAIKSELGDLDMIGRVGEIYQVSFRLRPGDGQGPDAYLERQPYFQMMPRFLIHETAVHFVDVFRFLLGEVASVWAELDRLNPVIAGEDRCFIAFTFKSGAKAVLDGNRLADHQAQNLRLTMGEMMIEGALGTLKLNGDGEVSFRAHGDDLPVSVTFEWDDTGFGGDCVYRFTRHLVDHYVTGSERMNSGREYLENLRIEEAIYQSAAMGKRLTL